MYPGLTRDQQTALDAAIRTSHSMRVGIDVLDLNHKHLGTLDSLILEGQVNVSAGDEVTHSATITFYDPARQLDFDSANPGQGALFADRMLRITYGVRAPALGAEWIEVPIFTGPVVRFTRNPHTVVVECQGKERLSLGNYWGSATYKGGKRKADIIRDILADQGERYFSLSSPGDRAGDVKMRPDTVPWTVAKQLASSMGQQLFYDGAGYVRMRSAPTAPAVVFSGGDGGLLLGEPTIGFSLETLRNAVQVTGSPSGSGKRRRPAPVAREVAPTSHPLSPSRLGRNGKKRIIAEFISESAIVTQSAANTLAEKKLAQLLLQQVDVAAETLVVPRIEPGDVATIDTPEATYNFALHNFSIPLTADGRMSVGRNQRVTPRQRGRGTLIA